jgi:hydrogenase assembly chaperone HypC/HupF
MELSRIERGGRSNARTCEMCLAFPGRVTEVAPDWALVSTEGRLRRASMLLHPDVRPGEWVIVAAGTIVRRLDDEEAEAIRLALTAAIDRTANLKGTSDGDS